MKIDNIIKYLLYLSSLVFIDDFGISPLKIKVLTILMVIDILTGVMKSHFSGNYFRSKKLTVGITGKFLIILLPIVLQLCGKGIGVEMSFLTSSLFNFLIISETYSVITNMRSIKERKNLKEYDAFTIILKIIGDSLMKFMELTKNSFEKSLNASLGGKDEVKEEKEKPTKTL